MRFSYLYFHQKNLKRICATRRNCLVFMFSFLTAPEHKRKTRIKMKWRMILIYFKLILIISNNVIINGRTLDELYLIEYRIIRNSFANYFREDKSDESLYIFNKLSDKLQRQIPANTKFFCDPNGPGRRSPIPPTSVHQIRPGDIDIIGALGDSLTAGNGILATNLFEVIREDKGASWCIGGDKTWRQYLTLPNILKEFNPNLYGYSRRSGITIEYISKFNVAEPMALSEDMVYQAKILTKRMLSNRNVDMKNHWKMVTIFIGHNNICSIICQRQDYENVLKEHENDLIEVLRHLRDHVPRLIINYVPIANLRELLTLRRLPVLCEFARHIECSCLFNLNSSYETIQNYLTILERWQKLDQDIANRDEFHNKEDFTVISHPFSINSTLPLKEDGSIDLSILSADCFHFSQKGHARMANGLWNSLFQPEGTKLTKWSEEFQHVECPTEEFPYIRTRKNSNNRYYH